jgi:sodium-dependent dicarboxylate transporter 2/3/5
MTVVSPSAENEPSESGAISRGEAHFERWRKTAGVLLAPVAFLLAYSLCDGDLTTQGQRLAGILAAVAVLWMTETLALPVTALLGACLCVVLGVADAKTVFAPFADPIVFLFIGSFMLARAMMVHALDRRMALAVLAIPWVSMHPARVLASMGLVTAILSMWVSNTATTAMMAPIALGVLQALHEARVTEPSGQPLDLRSWKFGTGMMLMIAYAASIGGVATPVGSPPNLIAISLIRNLADVHISFFEWMSLMLPIFCVMAVVLFVLLYLLHPAEGTTHASTADLRRYLQAQRTELGPWTVGQINTLIAFGVAMTLWVLPGAMSVLLPSDHAALVLMNARLPEAVVAIFAAILLFALPTRLSEGRFTLAWRDATKIDWGTILLFGGGLSLGSLMFSTGVAAELGEAVTGATGVRSVWGLTAVAVAMGIFLSETTSNTAAANMLIPAVIAMAQSAGVNPVPPALGACLGASFGFMLPVSTPPNAIVYGTGLVAIPKMMRAGVLFDVCGFAAIVIGLRLFCPLLGFSD